MNSKALLIRICSLLAATLLVAGCGGGNAGASATESATAVGPNAAQLPPFNFEIRTLSNRADLVSDGDALVEVRVPQNVPMQKVTLTLNGVDVLGAFVADANARTFRGVLTGMRPGENVFVADSNATATDGPVPT
jgi:hypothetical protein